MLTTKTPSTAQLMRRPLQPRKQFFRKSSRSMNSIKHLKGRAATRIRIIFSVQLINLYFLWDSTTATVIPILKQNLVLHHRRVVSKPIPLKIRPCKLMLWVWIRDMVNSSDFV